MTFARPWLRSAKSKAMKMEAVTSNHLQPRLQPPCPKVAIFSTTQTRLLRKNLPLPNPTGNSEITSLTLPHLHYFIACFSSRAHSYDTPFLKSTSILAAPISTTTKKQRRRKKKRISPSNQPLFPEFPNITNKNPTTSEFAFFPQFSFLPFFLSFPFLSSHKLKKKKKKKTKKKKKKRKKEKNFK